MGYESSLAKIGERTFNEEAKKTLPRASRQEVARCRCDALLVPAAKTEKLRREDLSPRESNFQVSLIAWGCSMIPARLFVAA